MASRQIDRRRVLQSVALAAGVGLAGCNGDGDDGGGGDGELGERVPDLLAAYFSDASQVAVAEDTVPIMAEDWRDTLGLNIEVKARGVSKQVGDDFNDNRNQHLIHYYHESVPARFDPHLFTRVYNGADNAGANGKPSFSNYASCEYTPPAVKQAAARSIEERKSLINEAHTIMADDMPMINLSRLSYFYGLRKDLVNANRVGAMGFGEVNPYFQIASTPKQGNNLIVGTTIQTVESKNFLANESPLYRMPWEHLLHSPLIAYDENQELQNILAEDYQVEGNKTFTVTLKDASFHNGDPITSEHVKWTYQFMSDNADSFPGAETLPYSSIDTPDDKTVVFNLEKAHPPFLSKTMPTVAVLHKGTWEDAGDDPAQYKPDDLIGSGAFQLANFQSSVNVRFEPSGTHPMFSPDHNVIFQGFQEDTAAVQAFKEGEVHVISQVAPTLLDRVKEDMGDDKVAESRLRGVLPFCWYMRYGMAPFTFREFRQALNMAVNRKRVNEVGLLGKEEPVYRATPLMPNHPFYPGKDKLFAATEEPEGDMEGAKAVLEEAGWGWDSDGNLHYPADADLTPLWPDGDQPSSNNGFDCLNSDGEYAGPTTPTG